MVFCLSRRWEIGKILKSEGFDLKTGRVEVKQGVIGGVKGGKKRTVYLHTFAITYLRSGGDIFTLQSLLSHNFLVMGRHYAQTAEIDIAQAHHKASPADNWRL